MFNKLLKQYDPYLGYKRNIDGSIVIYRQSPYTAIEYEVLIINNQYLGSFRWVLRKIIMMDSRRKDFIVSAINHNNKQRKTKKDDRHSREVADYIYNSGMTFIS